MDSSSSNNCVSLEGDSDDEVTQEGEGEENKYELTKEGEENENSDEFTEEGEEDENSDEFTDEGEEDENSDEFTDEGEEDEISDEFTEEREEDESSDEFTEEGEDDNDDEVTEEGEEENDDEVTEEGEEEEEDENDDEVNEKGEEGEEEENDDDLSEEGEEYESDEGEEEDNNGGAASPNLELGRHLISSSEQEPRRSDLHRRHHYVSATAGAGSSSSSSSSSSLLQLQAGLGGLGFHNGGVREGSGEAPSNYHHHGSSSCAWPGQVGTGPSGPRVECGNPQVHIPKTAGLWFTLHSTPNVEGEMLPQIPSAYIRVKEENMTILTVKKYLVTKLGLTSVIEIDISCLGQPLLNSHTLKYVRDVIWGPTMADHLNAVASGDAANEISSNLVMPLHYERHCP